MDGRIMRLVGVSYDLVERGLRILDFFLLKGVDGQLQGAPGNLEAQVGLLAARCPVRLGHELGERSILARRTQHGSCQDKSDTRRGANHCFLGSMAMSRCSACHSWSGYFPPATSRN